MKGTDPLWRELLDSTFGGFAYGATAAVLSHPLDTIKTRQQAMPGMAGSSSRDVLRDTLTRGFPELYRGFLPALAGSVLFRAVPFVAYSSSTAVVKEQCPAWSARHPVMLAAGGGACGGLLRAVMECPLEVLKVRRQVHHHHHGSAMHHHGSAMLTLWSGLGWTLARNMLVIGLFWAILEASRSTRERLTSSRAASSFLAGAGCSAVAWAVAFPLDVCKSRAQSGKYSKSDLGVLKAVLEQGYTGAYSGLAMGLGRVIIANGCAMVAYDFVRDVLIS